MKNVMLLALLSLLAITACQDDEDDTGPNPSENELRYDGPNATGPLLEAGTHEAAVRFPANYLQDFQGRELEVINFFLGQLPAACEARVYEGSTAEDEPETMIYSFDLSTLVEAPSWNRLTLTNPIVIGEEDLWLSIVLTHDQEQQSIGCDTGPNQPNGDWLYKSTDGQWRPYTERTSESVNWNIRGELSE
jgi:hypothetical protein